MHAYMYMYMYVVAVVGMLSESTKFKNSECLSPCKPE